MEGDTTGPPLGPTDRRESTPSAARRIEELVSVSRAASRAGVSTQHIRKLCRDGVLEAVRSGDGRQSWLITAESFERYLSNHTVRSNEPDQDVFAELELAAERVRAATLAEQLAQRTADLQVAQARIGELERRLVDEKLRSTALVRAQEALLGSFQRSTD